MKLKKSALAVILLIIALIIFAVILFTRPKNTENTGTPEPTAEAAGNTDTQTADPAETASPTADTQQNTVQPTETPQQGGTSGEPTPTAESAVQVTDQGDVVIELQEDEESFGE